MNYKIATNLHLPEASKSNTCLETPVNKACKVKEGNIMIAPGAFESVQEHLGTQIEQKNSEHHAG